MTELQSNLITLCSIMAGCDMFSFVFMARSNSLRSAREMEILNQQMQIGLFVQVMSVLVTV